MSSSFFSNQKQNIFFSYVIVVDSTDHVVYHKFVNATYSKDSILVVRNKMVQTTTTKITVQNSTENKL